MCSSVRECQFSSVRECQFSSAPDRLFQLDQGNSRSEDYQVSSDHVKIASNAEVRFRLSGNAFRLFFSEQC
jgi:hypothetical protein